MAMVFLHPRTQYCHLITGYAAMLFSKFYLPMNLAGPRNYLAAISEVPPRDAACSFDTLRLLRARLRERGQDER